MEVYEKTIRISRGLLGFIDLRELLTLQQFFVIGEGIEIYYKLSYILLFRHYGRLLWTRLWTGGSAGADILHSIR